MYLNYHGLTIEKANCISTDVLFSNSNENCNIEFLCLTDVWSKERNINSKDFYRTPLL